MQFKMIANGFEIFRHTQIWILCNTFTVPEAHRYEQNKTGTTDTDYEHMKRKKQELASESYPQIFFANALFE